MMGPPSEIPYCLRSKAGSGLPWRSSMKLRSVSERSVYWPKTSPWNSFVPDLVTAVMIAAPACFYSAL